MLRAGQFAVSHFRANSASIKAELLGWQQWFSEEFTARALEDAQQLQKLAGSEHASAPALALQQALADCQDKVAKLKGFKTEAETLKRQLRDEQNKHEVRVLSLCHSVSGPRQQALLRMCAADHALRTSVTNCISRKSHIQTGACTGVDCIPQRELTA